MRHRHHWSQHLWTRFGLSPLVDEPQWAIRESATSNTRFRPRCSDTVVHEPPPPLEQVRARVGGFDLSSAPREPAPP